MQWMCRPPHLGSPTLTRMPTSPGPLLDAISALWARLRTAVPAIPPVRPVISPTSSPANHGAERWGRDADGAVTGLVVSVDVLQAGPEAVLEHLLHEAAHILNWLRGAADTATRGAYHNAHFLTAAEEVGLHWPEGADRSVTRGFDQPRLTAAAKEWHKPDLQALNTVIPLVLPHLELPTSKRSRTPDRLTLECKCSPPRRFRISRTVAALGPITCGVCGEEFTSQ